MLVAHQRALDPKVEDDHADRQTDKAAPQGEQDPGDQDEPDRPDQHHVRTTPIRPFADRLGRENAGRADKPEEAGRVRAQMEVRQSQPQSQNRPEGAERGEQSGLRQGRPA